MNKIISKEHFSEKVFKLVIEAPLIAKSRKAGHFVIVRVGEKGERMPLTIAEADPVKGTITLVVQEVGLSSTRLCELNEGDYITDVVGPLGQATHIDNFGTVVCAGGGVGVAPMLPIVQALKAAGNRVITVLAGRTKELIILEKEMRESSDEVIIMTDDGSYGRKGLVTEGVEEVIKREKVNKCFAIGPAIMMKFVCLLTKKYEIPTDVSLNTIMVDGTGMCGACRITIGGKTKFVCVDGPEFDGHQVDFDEMLKRMGAFKNIEREEMHKLEEPQTCQATGENMEDEKSRNDQVALDMHMYMKRVVTEVMDLVIRFEEALLMVADKNQDTLMPGYTHLQRAQPITFCHHLLAYFNMFLRDFRRLEGVWKGADIMPLGAGAVAGTTLPIDRKCRLRQGKPRPHL